MAEDKSAGGDWMAPLTASQQFGLGLDLLQNLRSSGKGPPWIKLSAKTVRYNRPEFISWLAAHDATNQKSENVSVAAVVRDAVARLEALERIVNSLPSTTPGISEDAGRLKSRIGSELDTLRAIELHDQVA